MEKRVISVSLDQNVYDKIEDLEYGYRKKLRNPPTRSKIINDMLLAQLRREGHMK